MRTKPFEQTGLYIGWAMEDVTPKEPVSLFGQYYERISSYVESPLTVTACAIESVGTGARNEQAILVSMDSAWTTGKLQDAVRQLVEDQIPDFDTGKLLINATHTHSAPNPDIETAYGKFLLERIGRAVVTAWARRKIGGVSAALGYAVVGHNRRVKYRDGSAEMYGSTEREDFLGLEGASDSGVDMLFCWDAHENLTGIIVNVSCPAQVTEAKYFVSGDFWSEVKRQLKGRLTADVFILAQCGAAGDISPRDLARGYRSGEPNMWDIPGMIEIGRRLTATIMDSYPLARQAIQMNAPFVHVVKELDVPTRIVSRQEYEEAVRISAEIHSREPADPDSPESAWNKFLREVKENEKIKEYGPWDNKNSDYGIVRKKDAAIAQYLHQDPLVQIELHVIRLGDIAMASNPFELFVEYGFRIKGRSKAKQTFLVQLCCDYCDYLPTQKALAGGGYSAMATLVGPPGGDRLVSETIELIDRLWT